MRPRVHKRERMTAMIRFLVTPSQRDRLWRFCEMHGILPSEVLRAGLLKELARLEAEYNPKEKGGETK